jgi:ATP-dependent helicase Lhr and Lhr-like helicase
MDDGTLILGPAGERLVDHYTFYASFSTPAEYRLVTDDRLLGTLPISFPLAVDSYLIFGGRRWRVAALDESTKTVHVEPAAGGRRASSVRPGSCTTPSGSGCGTSTSGRTSPRTSIAWREACWPKAGRRSSRAVSTGEHGRVRSRDAGLRLGRRSRFGDGAPPSPRAGPHRFARRPRHRGEGQQRSRGVERAAGAADRPARRAGSSAPGSGQEREKHHDFLSEELLAVDYASAILDLEGASRAVADLPPPAPAVG